MNSPVSFFSSVDNSNTQPLYIQIAESIKLAITKELLPVQYKLPGSRKLSEHFNVHRITVNKALELLSDQGFIDIYANKGCFVRKRQKPINTENIIWENKQAHFPLSSHPILDGIDRSKAHSHKFFIKDDTQDWRLFPVEKWQTALSSATKKNSHIKYYNQIDNQGNIHYRIAVKNYLNKQKNIVTKVENMLTCSHIDMALEMLLNLLLQSHDQVIVTAPGYYKTNLHLANRQIKIHPWLLEMNELSLITLEKICKKHPIKAVFIPASLTYPFNESIKSQFGARILSIIVQYKIPIIEINLENDYLLSPNTLFAQDKLGQVIYVDSFSGILPPNVQSTVILGAENFIQKLQNHKLLYHENYDLIKEMAIAEIFKLGHFQRHLLHLQNEYSKRKAHAIELLKIYFSNAIEIPATDSHTNITIIFHQKINLRKLQTQCLANDLFIDNNVLIQNKQQTAMRFSFTHINYAEISHIIQIIHQEYRKIQQI